MSDNSLRGLHIVITRPRDQSENLANLIKLHGGIPIIFPLIEIVPLSDYFEFDNTIQNFPDYDLAIFISTLSLIHI